MPSQIRSSCKPLWSVALQKTATGNWHLSFESSFVDCAEKSRALMSMEGTRWRLPSAGGDARATMRDGRPRPSDC